ncbi:DUF4314 domain-containing protein [Micromonospora sp. WMMD710]|uniref:DUF4314 domain-containing protein n=1 Tax=Micromonospora sp. WMMD710 TaxID=3016085 RepID=UPI002417B27F|nr:DUF4314 domain-containing protein [Micromonospora sp. WMMD710]MDG4760367.1 DUF4314 domain-containing protein [Micromonospora sp. WMMD710]
MNSPDNSTTGGHPNDGNSQLHPAQPEFQAGDRVMLEHTDDPHTGLLPGDTGSVWRYEPGQQVLDVQWDSGSRLSLLLNKGDHVRGLPDATWQRVLDGLRAAGTQAGHDAAGTWVECTLAHRASSDTTATAREVLASIEADDGRDIEGLPFPDRYDGGQDAIRYAQHAPPGAARWEDLLGWQPEQTRWSWCDGFDTAVTTDVVRQCRIILHPDGDERDLRHVYPEHVRLGGVGVFAGDWAWTPNAAGDMRIGVGFVGTLIDTWNGWAVFRCAREVAEAIVADQQAHRDQFRQQLAAAGVPEADLDARVDESMGRMAFDGDVIVADDTRVQDDPDAIDRIHPTDDGQYVVMGWNWTWIAVHPYDCDRIVGAIPDPLPHPSNPASASAEGMPHA